ncbi:MAG: DUF1080 domain-containing protein [Chitinophagaceae bacterium]|nr:DUF1080 domain-containing protein [Chitinophagaceae bacterium]
MQTLFFTSLLSLTILLGNPEKKSPTNLEKGKGWISLFDGKTTKGWHTYGKTSVGDAWKVADGALYLDASNKDNWQVKGGGDIITDESFENFDLKLEWKISKNGNSGIIFYIQDDPAKYKYIWYTGPEMQILDNDGHSDGKIVKHRAGNLYDLVEGKEGAVKPVGEWNEVEIISNKGKLELKLNGITVVSTTYGDDNWKNLIANSKFKSMPDFGKVFNGHIGLQDHGNDVWFKNIKIKKL